MKPFLKSSYEGYVCIDHTDSPGFDGKTAELGHRLSIHKYTGRGQKFQAATNTCSHCDRVVIRNPDRIRARGHCTNCDRFVCDPCAVAHTIDGECLCREKRIDLTLKGALNGT